MLERAGRKRRTERRAVRTGFLQIQQTGPFVDPAFRQRPGPTHKDIREALVIWPDKNTALSRQGVQAAQRRVTRLKIRIRQRPARSASHDFARQFLPVGRAVPALPEQAHGKGLAHFPQHGAQNITEHQNVIVHQKKLAALTTLKGILVADTRYNRAQSHHTANRTARIAARSRPHAPRCT